MNVAIGVRMRALSVVFVATLGCLLTAQVPSAQRKPDLSGTWIFLEARAAETRTGGPGPVRVLEVSGAAFNCGAQCTIVQSDQTLTVSRAASENERIRPDVVLKLGAFGNLQTQPGQPVQRYDAIAEWDGDRLSVTRAMGVLQIQQTLALEENRLVVTSLIVTGSPGDGPVSQTYVRK